MPRPPAASPPRFRRRGRWGRCSTYPSIARAAEAGQLQLFDAGVSLDADFLWFNLTEARARADTGRPWLRRVELRQAIAHAVDREVFANSVYLGLADPIHGPVTPGNRVWFSADAPAYPFDRNRARALLAEVGLIDRDGDGLLEDTAREDARFTLLTQRGSTPRERASAVLQEDLRQIGLTVDVVPLEFGALIEGSSGRTTTRSTSARSPATPTRRSAWVSGSARAPSTCGIRGRSTKHGAETPQHASAPSL